MIDYYNILQLETNANEQEIKDAFRRLAKKFHPDKNESPDAPEEFKKVYMAYEVLSDPYKKKLYDELSASRSYEEHTPSSFNYNAGFDEWEYRAAQRANHYADMRFSQFEKQELKGLDYYYHQVALTIGIIGLFFIGGMALYFSKNIVSAYLSSRAEAMSLIGAFFLAIFGLFVLYYVNQMSKVFRQSVLQKFRKK